VDPVLEIMANPQRLNRYGYVLNDPVNYVDPDGLKPVKPELRRGGRREPPEGWEKVEFGNVTGA
jgi:hypothetical protein